MANIYQIMPYERDALLEFIKMVVEYVNENDGPDALLDGADECFNILSEYAFDADLRQND